MDDINERTEEQNETKDISESTDGIKQDEALPYTEEHVSVPEQKEPQSENEDGKKSKKPLKVPLFAAIIAVLAVAVLTSQITFLAVRQSYHSKLASVSRDKFSDSKLSQVDEIYKKYYIGDVNDDELVDGLIQGYMYGAGDRYGSYMTKEEYAEYMESMQSRTVGIGVYVTWDDELSCIEILEVYENSPAEAAGISEGDRIVGVDGYSIAELGYENSVTKIRGEAGTKVRITVEREGESAPLTFEMTRREVKSKTVKTKVFGNIAVIAISNFFSQTPAELKAAVADLKNQGCDRIVFDLRNNTGGLLESIQEVLDYILPEGITVRMTDAKGNTTTLRSDAACLKMPMVVVVNGRTASAAELFAAALRDYGYATIVGTQTFGKGTVTSPYQLSDGSVIYISSELYYPPVSDNFEGVGITPDVITELNEEAKNKNLYKLPLENDDQLKKAVEIIKEK
jgi:carboxyl-terminal processing protease